jgi:predicted ATPase
MGEFIHEQPVSTDIRYIFKHALTQEVAYNSLLVERRKIIHERAAQALEEIYRSKLDDYYVDLAHHYRRSGNTRKAVDYLQLAGQQAVERSAHAEAIQHLTSALELLKSQLDSPESIRQELILHTLLASVLMEAKGYAAPEVQNICERARELCQQKGEVPQLLPLLHILVGFYVNKGELQTARDLAAQMVDLAQGQQELAFLPQAHYSLGLSSFFLGDFVAALEQTELALANYDLHGSVALQVIEDPRIASLCFGAWAQWHLGYGDQALHRIQQALSLTEQGARPYDRALAMIFDAWLRQFRRESGATQEDAVAAIALSNERGFPFWSSLGSVLLGWALSQQGQGKEGISRISHGLAGHRATGAKTVRSWSLALLAEACGGIGQVQKGLDALTEALAVMNETGERFYEAEVYRLRGELLLVQDVSKMTEAERCFDISIQLAKRQRARSFELRATTSLARLLRDTGRHEEARTMLTEIYTWFTEGFDTADLKDAKALLDQLAATR